MSHPTAPRPDLPCEHPYVNEVWVTTCDRCRRELERRPAMEIELSKRVLQLETELRILQGLQRFDAPGKHAAIGTEGRDA